jgi:hypothetical protein
MGLSKHNKNAGVRRDIMRRMLILAVGITFMLFSTASLFAQGRGEDQNTYEGSANAVSAGGNWMEYSSEDRMTAAKRTRFELPANSAPRSDPSAKVILYCTNGKLTLADFHPGERLSRPNWPGFWGQPQMRVRVRVDDAHSDHNWNWIHGHFLAMDKGTTRELLGAHLFRVEFLTPDGPQIAEFTPAGVDLKLVKDSCDLTPKKP